MVDVPFGLRSIHWLHDPESMDQWKHPILDLCGYNYFGHFDWALVNLLLFVSGLRGFVVILEVSEWKRKCVFCGLLPREIRVDAKRISLFCVWRHVNDSYLNLVGLCNIDGARWRWDVIPLVASLMIIVYFCDYRRVNAVADGTSIRDTLRRDRRGRGPSR